MSEEALSEEYKAHLSPGKDWKEIVAWVGDLPPLPHVAAQALSLIEDPTVTAGKLSDLLGQDTALAARVLKIANSAMFSRQREISTINQAVMMIGFKTLKGVIVAATLRQLNRKFGDVEKMIWQNSACTAVAGSQLTRVLKKDFGDEAFLLGLLHDLGKLVLVRQIPEDYQKVVDTTGEGKTYVDVEQEMFGFAHPLIGALVAKKWNFSLDICQVILHHHNPISGPPEDEAQLKTLVVQTADTLAHHLGYGHIEGYPEQKEELFRLLGYLDLDEAAGEKLIETVRDDFAEQGSLFN